MKKTIVLILGVIFLISCENPELKKNQEKLEELKCRADFSKQLAGYTGTIGLAIEVGMSKELDEFQKLASDSTVNCAERKKAWDAFSKKVSEAAK